MNAASSSARTLPVPLQLGHTGSFCAVFATSSARTLPVPLQFGHAGSFCALIVTPCILLLGRTRRQGRVQVNPVKIRCLPTEQACNCFDKNRKGRPSRAAAGMTHGEIPLAPPVALLTAYALAPLPQQHIALMRSVCHITAPS